MNHTTFDGLRQDSTFLNKIGAIDSTNVQILMKCLNKPARWLNLWKNVVLNRNQFKWGGYKKEGLVFDS